MALTAEARALLETIAGPESAGKYDVIYGGSRFSDYSDHPRRYVTITSGPNRGQKSSAAGKYQFLGSTWDDISGRYGLADFSPANQDAAAWHLASEEYRRDTGRELQADLAAGDLSRVSSSLRNQWTSMPGGIEQGISGSAFATAYQAALGKPMPVAQVPPNAVSAINEVAPPAVAPKPAAIGYAPTGGVMRPGRAPAQAGGPPPSMGTLAGRTAIMRAAMAGNIGKATVKPGSEGRGVGALAIGPGGSSRVMISSPSRGGNEVYRANAAILGPGGFTQDNINRALAAGHTLYKPLMRSGRGSSGGDRYSVSASLSGGNGP